MSSWLRNVMLMLSHAISCPWHPCSDMPAQAFFVDQFFFVFPCSAFFLAVFTFSLFGPIKVIPRCNLWAEKLVKKRSFVKRSWIFVKKLSEKFVALIFLWIFVAVVSLAQVNIFTPRITLRRRRKRRRSSFRSAAVCFCLENFVGLTKKQTFTNFTKGEDKRFPDVSWDASLDVSFGTTAPSLSHFKQIFAILRLCTLEVTVVKVQCTEKKHWPFHVFYVFHVRFHAFILHWNLRSKFFQLPSHHFITSSLLEGAGALSHRIDQSTSNVLIKLEATARGIHLSIHHPETLSMEISKTTSAISVSNIQNWHYLHCLCALQHLTVQCTWKDESHVGKLIQ